MPRTARAVEADGIYHVLNRGNGRMQLFHKPADFDAFIKVLSEGLARYPVDLLTYCLMSNHWHLVLRPREAPALGRFMGWLGVTHVRRHHAHYGSRGGGHLYQGRFKSFPVQDDGHFLTVCRYVEANALRAAMVERAEDWPYGGLSARSRRSGKLPLSQWPVGRPANWMKLVNAAVEEPTLVLLRESVNGGKPFGSEQWVAKTARRLGLEHTLRGAGRPKKNAIAGNQ
jgi:putative transposase